MGRYLDHLFRKAGHAYSTGRWIVKSFAGSDEEEIAAEYMLGRSLAGELLKNIEREEDDAAGELVNRIGRDLCARLTNKKRRFTFIPVKSGEVNAFALPGGFVFVTTSLLSFCESDADELAFVLGHEMGHIVRGHAFDRMISNSALKIISNFHPATGFAGALSQKAISGLLTSQYSQDQELEADAFGVGIMNAAGYDMSGAAALMKKLATRLGQPDGGLLKKYYSSHPEAAIRLKHIREEQKRRS
ncbi:MAG: M48 family metallopeptidase [Calditrichia bacterium]